MKYYNCHHSNTCFVFLYVPATFLFKSVIFVLKAGIPNLQVCFGGLREAKNVSRTIDLTSKELPIPKEIVTPISKTSVRLFIQNLFFHNFPNKKSQEVPLKDIRMILWKLNFSNVSKGNLKTDFVIQLHVLLAFIWCIDYTYQDDVC